MAHQVYGPEVFPRVHGGIILNTSWNDTSILNCTKNAYNTLLYSLFIAFKT